MKAAPKPEDDDAAISIVQAGKILGCGKMVAYRYVSNGKLKSYRIGNLRRTTRAWVRECQEALRRETAEADAKGLQPAVKRKPAEVAAPACGLPEPIGYVARVRRKRQAVA